MEERQETLASNSLLIALVVFRPLDVQVVYHLIHTSTLLTMVDCQLKISILILHSMEHVNSRTECKVSQS